MGLFASVQNSFRTNLHICKRKRCFSLYLEKQTTTLDISTISEISSTTKCGKTNNNIYMKSGYKNAFIFFKNLKHWNCWFICNNTLYKSENLLSNYLNWIAIFLLLWLNHTITYIHVQFSLMCNLVSLLKRKTV